MALFEMEALQLPVIIEKFYSFDGIFQYCNASVLWMFVITLAQDLGYEVGS